MSCKRCIYLPTGERAVTCEPCAKDLREQRRRQAKSINNGCRPFLLHPHIDRSKFRTVRKH